MQDLYIYFDLVKYNKKTNEIELKGGVASYIDKRDTLFLDNVKIFKAKNHDDTLLLIEPLIYDSKLSNLKFKEGQFYFKTYVDSIKKLYFVGANTRVYEYNLPRLLNSQ